jgi:hypothetical protein
MTSLPANLNRHLIIDLQRICGTTDLLAWVEDRCSQLASLGLSNHCIRLSKSLLESAGIAEIVSAAQINGLASLSTSDQTSYKISVRPFLSSQDRRFAIAHEIAHTLWYRPDAAGIPLSRLQAPYGVDETIEWLSNRAGAALLVPKLFLEDYPHDTFVHLYRGGIHLVPPCARQLDVPERLLARRVSHDLLNSRNLLMGLEVSAKAQDDAVIQWAVLPEASRADARRRLENKRIPRDAIPEIPQGQTREMDIDGRWRSFLASLLQKSRMSTFTKCGNTGALRATIGRWGSRFIISIGLAQFELSPGGIPAMPA